MRRFIVSLLCRLSDLLHYLRWQTDRLSARIARRSVKKGIVTPEEYMMVTEDCQKQMNDALSRAFYKDEQHKLGKV